MTVLANYTWGDPAHPPVICLHGIRAYGLRFRKLAQERLADRFHVVALDLRGHGHSTFDPPWGMATHLADITETMDALEIGGAVWIGHSLGGRLALEACATDPERVVGTVLLDPAVQLTPERAREGADSERPERVYRSREEAIAERIESKFVRESSRPYLEEEAEVHLVSTADGRFRLRYEQAAAVTAWGECAALLPPLTAVPTLLITGRESGFVTDQQRDLLRARLGSRLQESTVPGGHVVLWDAYQMTAHAIDVFLGDIPSW